MPLVLRVVILISVFSTTVLAKDSDIENKINHLNKISTNTLGVSLNALNYLVDASKGTYVPLWLFEKTGKIKFIYELESAGYLEVNKRNGLPDGTERDEMFLNIVPVGKGIEIRKAMLSLRNSGNKSEDELKEEIQLLLKTLDKKLAVETRKIELIEAKEAEKLDLNKDGIQDVFYEDKDDSYYMLTDRNFDGEIDERLKYDLSDILLSGKADNNFDRVFETKYIIQDGFIHREFIDSDHNGIYDIYHKYEFGVLNFSEKYYGTSDSGTLSRIGMVKYKLNEISDDEVFIETKISESEFQEERLK